VLPIPVPLSAVVVHDDQAGLSHGVRHCRSHSPERIAYRTPQDRSVRPV